MTQQPNNVSAPFSNCRFQICDLPGQCIGEGKCHHPAVAAASAQATGQAVDFDGDSEATRKAFRDYDAEYPVRHRSEWQIWRDAIAYAVRSGVAAPSPAAREAGDGVTLTDGQREAIQLALSFLSDKAVTDARVQAVSVISNFLREAGSR